MKYVLTYAMKINQRGIEKWEQVSRVTRVWENAQTIFFEIKHSEIGNGYVQ